MGGSHGFQGERSGDQSSPQIKTGLNNKRRDYSGGRKGMRWEVWVASSRRSIFRPVLLNESLEQAK